MRTLFLISLIVLSIGVSCSSKSGNRSASLQNNEIVDNSEFLAVTKIVDGDTFWVDNGSEKGLKIRLIGVDAPESRNVFNKKKGYYGPEAKAYVTDLISNQSVRLEYDVDRLDRYGRTLAYVYLRDGTFLNADLVKNGYAMVMTVPPNVKHDDEFVRYQQDAREHRRGLWRMHDEL